MRPSARRLPERLARKLPSKALLGAADARIMIPAFRRLDQRRERCERRAGRRGEAHTIPPSPPGTTFRINVVAPQRRQAGRRVSVTALRILDIRVDTLPQDGQRDPAVFEHRIVEGPQVEARAQCRFRLFA
jgi:hypothetical protein